MNLAPGVLKYFDFQMISRCPKILNILVWLVSWGRSDETREVLNHGFELKTHRPPAELR